MSGTSLRNGRNPTNGLSSTCKNFLRFQSFEDLTKILLVGRKIIQRREGIERKIVTGRAEMIATTTQGEEVTAAVNIPEEIHELDGLTILMECNRQPVHL